MQRDWRICIALLMSILPAWLHAAPVDVGAGSIVSGPNPLAWENVKHDFNFYSTALAVDDGYLLLIDAMLFRIESDGTQDRSFGTGGSAHVHGRATLAEGADGQWYMAKLNPPGMMSSVMIGKVGRDGSVRYDWGPLSTLVYVSPNSGWLADDIRLFVDGSGVYLFAAQTEGTGTAALFYAAWNLDGTPKVLSSGQNSVLIPIPASYGLLGDVEVISEDGHWVLHARSGEILDGILALRITRQGELDAGFANAGVLMAVLNYRSFSAVTSGHYYLLGLEEGPDFTAIRVLRRFDRSGIEDVDFGEKLLNGLPTNEDGDVVSVRWFSAANDQLDLWIAEEREGSFYNTRWRINPDAATAEVIPDNVFQGYPCNGCDTSGGKPLYYLYSPEAEPNTLISYQEDGGLSVVTVAELTFTYTLGPPIYSRADRVDALLWPGPLGFSQDIDVLATNLEGRRLAGVGRYGVITLQGRGGSESFPASATGVAYHDGNMLLKVSGPVKCIEVDSFPELIFWISPQGKVISSRDVVDLRDQVAQAGSDTDKECFNWIGISGYSNGGIELIANGDAYALTGSDLNQSARVYDGNSADIHFPLYTDGHTVGRFVTNRVLSSPAWVNGHAPIRLLDDNLVVDSDFNNGNPLDIASLFSGEACKANLAGVRQDSLMRFILAGVMECDGITSVFLIRLLRDGTPDPDFHEDGILYADESWANAYVSVWLELQSDDKPVLLISGARQDEAYRRMRMKRFNLDGSLDPSFASEGVLNISEVDGSSLGKQHEIAGFFYRESGDFSIFYYRDREITQLEIAGDSPGPEETSFFQQASSSSGSVAFWFLPLAIFGLIFRVYGAVVFRKIS